MSVAFVTGGARAIGRAIAQTLADDGQRVAVADLLDAEGAQTATAIGGLAVHLDVTDAGSIDAAVTEAERKLGPHKYLGQQRRRGRVSSFGSGGIHQRTDAVGEWRTDNGLRGERCGADRHQL
jgi:NAD(P)-dependent dehydrogenase (short-subunit alcohol dehydrogenase family)